MARASRITAQERAALDGIEAEIIAAAEEAKSGGYDLRITTGELVQTVLTKQQVAFWLDEGLLRITNPKSGD